MSIKTNNAMAALLKTTDIPGDVQSRLATKPEPVAAAVDAEPEPVIDKPKKKHAAPASKPRRDADDDVNVGMTHLHRGESTKQFTLRMPVTMWARLKLLTTRAQLTGQGTKTQQEMILKAVERFLDDGDDAMAA